MILYKLAATVVALVHELKRKGAIASLYDEAHTFLGSLGRYSNKLSYERSIYLELYSAKTFKRTLKAEGTVVVENPRFNLYLQGYPEVFIKVACDESRATEDGLMHRFFMSAPRPVYYMAEEIMETHPVEYFLSLLLFVIHSLHKKESVVYELSEDAHAFYCAKFNYFSELIRKFNMLENGAYVRLYNNTEFV